MSALSHDERRVWQTLNGTDSPMAFAEELRAAAQSLVNKGLIEKVVLHGAELYDEIHPSDPRYIP